MEEIDKNKKLYILLGLLLIVIFIVATNLIKKNLNAEIDYNSDNVVADLLKSATITYDREVYYIMEDIITNYIYSYDPFDIESVNSSYEDYYDVLEETYKSKLGKNKYKEVAQEFFKNVEVENTSAMDSHTNYITTNVIRRIYDLGNDSYLCLVGLLNSEENGYIGITINPTKNTYEIFYLE